MYNSIFVMELRAIMKKDILLKIIIFLILVEFVIILIGVFKKNIHLAIIGDILIVITSILNAIRHIKRWD